MTLSEALQQAIAKLKTHSTHSTLDAEILLAASIQRSHTYLYTYPDEPLDENAHQLLEAWIQRAVAGEPIAYILGRAYFWSLEFQVTPDVLIPRPETEHLVEWVLTHFSAETSVRVAELGTGSGAIACAIAHERPRWIIHATDQSAPALTIAKQNAQQHKLHNIEFFQGDWCHALPRKDYHCMISNPPYIAEGDPHLPALRFEPQSALVSGVDGLLAIKTIGQQAKNYLVNSGVLVLEHGYDQQATVITCLETEGFKNVVGHRDLAGVARYCTAELL